MAGLEAQIVEPPYNGMDSETAPKELERGFAQDVENFLVGRKGRVPLRNGIESHLPTAAPLWTPAELPSGIWVAEDGTYLAGRASSTTTRWAIYHQFANPWNSIVGTADQIPTYVHTRVGLSDVYGVSTTGKFVRWNGAGTLTTYVNAPLSMKDVKYYLNRLWYIGGAAVDAANSLYWSDQVFGGTALPDTAAAWQDDVSGLTNQIKMPSLGTEAIGLARLPNALIAFGRDRGHMIVGQTIASLTVKPHVISHGCMDRNSIVEYKQGVMWMARDGFFWFDGVNEVELSAKVRTALLSQTLDGSRVYACLLARDYVFITISTTLGQPTSSWLLHIPTQSWVRFSTAATSPYVAIGGISGVSTVNNALGHIFDGSQFWRLYEVSRVEVGFSVYDGAEGFGLAVPIVGSVTSKQLELATALHSSQLHRVIVDARAVDAAADITVSVEGSTADNDVHELANSSVGPTSGDHSRLVLDGGFAETNELQVAVTIEGSASHESPPELRDIIVEFQETRQQRTY